MFMSQVLTLFVCVCVSHKECATLHWSAAVCMTCLVLSLTFLSKFRLSHDVLCCATLKWKVTGERGSWGQKVRRTEERMTWDKRGEEKWRVIYAEQVWEMRRQRRDHYAALHRFLSPITTETAEGQWRCILSPLCACSPIWLSVCTFVLLLCTVSCNWVIMAYCIAYFHRNVTKYVFWDSHQMHMQ